MATLETKRREQSVRFFRVVHFGGVHGGKFSNRSFLGHIMYSTYQTRRCRISYENYLHLHDCEQKIMFHIQRKITTQQETSDRMQKSILSAKTEERAIGFILSTSSDK
jgi:hypothetical protein